MCQVFGGAESEDPVDNEIGLYIQSLCEKNSLLMQYKNILEQVKIFCFSSPIRDYHRTGHSKIRFPLSYRVFGIGGKFSL
jgi:hypothetical protein